MTEHQMSSLLFSNLLTRMLLDTLRSNGSHRPMTRNRLKHITRNQNGRGIQLTFFFDFFFGSGLGSLLFHCFSSSFHQFPIVFASFPAFFLHFP